MCITRWWLRNVQHVMLHIHQHPSSLFTHHQHKLTYIFYTHIPIDRHMNDSLMNVRWAACHVTHTSTSTLKRALYSVKRALHTSTLIDIFYTLSTYIDIFYTYINIDWYMNACWWICAMCSVSCDTHININSQKSPIFCQKSPIYSQKSPLFAFIVDECAIALQHVMWHTHQHQLTHAWVNQWLSHVSARNYQWVMTHSCVNWCWCMCNTTCCADW